MITKNRVLGIFGRLGIALAYLTAIHGVARWLPSSRGGGRGGYRTAQMKPRASSFRTLLLLSA